MKEKILIIEDEEELSRGLEINFRREGYQVLKAADGAAGLKKAVEEKSDLIILDWMLPGMSGLDVCRALRMQRVNIPIIMLTAKSQEGDKVLGLEMGADDYVTKPFGVRELIARVRAHLRRGPSGTAQPLEAYQFGQVAVDFQKFNLSRAGRPLEATAKEFEVLKSLILHRGEVVTRRRLLNEVWGYDGYPATRTVDNFIMRLRKKIEDDPDNPRFILSIYGEGYKFVG